MNERNEKYHEHKIFVSHFSASFVPYLNVITVKVTNLESEHSEDNTNVAVRICFMLSWRMKGEWPIWVSNEIFLKL
jgi:hypothetical protein